MVMVSPPVGFMDFDPIQPIGNLELIISGSRDDIAPTEGIKQLLSGWAKAPQVEIINGADHFFSGYSTELESVLYSNI